MTPQLVYGLKKAGIMVALAALAALGLEAPELISGAGLNKDIWVPIVGAVIAGTVRTFEAWRDGIRAEEGRVQPEDVRPIAGPTPPSFSQSVHPELNDLR
jgi:hypothetical protein